ncbi:MAG: hypothetical protein KDE51_26825 [Anaerolineales bacterium]|nr:hypothetical protein [Anaerolineales bacterium]
MSETPLRVVTFNFFPPAYEACANWIHQNGHQHVLAVTTPGPISRPTPGYKEIVTNAPREVDILVTTRLRKVATPLIRALQPDLIVCFSFPYRITPELCQIPRYGAVNLHPAVLPAYRGPNVFRAFYDGAAEFGATAHWIAEDYDTGHILSQKSAPMPDEITPNQILPAWVSLITKVLAEGLERALAGDLGTPQDHAQATYGGRFTEAEMWLDLNKPQRVIQRHVTGLNFGAQAKVKVGDESWAVQAVELRPQEQLAAVGQLIERTDESILVQVGDGPVRLQVTPLEPA